MATKKDLEKFLSKQKSLEIVQARYNKADSFFTRYVTDADRWYKLYRNLVSKPTSQYRSKVSVPVGFWTIETTVPRMVARPHIYSMTPRDIENDQAVDYSGVAKEYYDYVLDQIQLKRKTRLLAKDMKIFGSAFWKYGWSMDKKLPFLQNIAFGRILIDPSVTDPSDLQSCKYIIHLNSATKDDLTSNPNYDLTGVNLDNLEGTYDPMTDSKKTRESAKGRNTDVKDPIEKDYCIWEHWGFVEGKRRLITVLEKQWVIRDDPAPYEFWPFDMTVNTEDPDCILGIGDIEPVSDIIDDVNTNRRMRTDNKNIRTNVMLERQRNAGIRDEELLWRPGGIFDSNVSGGLIPLAIPDTTGGSLEEEMLNYQLIEKATNTPAQVQGQLRVESGTGGLLNRTATAFKGVQQETNIRFKYQSESLDMCVERTLTNMWKIIQKNVSGDEAALVIGEDDSRKWMKIPEEAIKAEYTIDIVFGSAALEDDQSKREEALFKFQTLSSTFGPQAGVVFLKDLLLAMGDKRVNETIAMVKEQVDKAAQEGTLPKPPQVNVSIGGEDMNALMVSDILKQAGYQFNPISLTPELNAETRRLMQGQTIESLEADKVKIQLFEAITKAKQGDQALSNEQIKIIGDITVKSMGNEQRATQRPSANGGVESTKGRTAEKKG